MDFLDIFIYKKDSSPLYSQLYTALTERIRSGQLKKGTRLPSKRAAAEQLGVSINTVDTAYQMLAAEGYVSALPRSGFVVNELERQLIPPPEPHALSPASMPLPEKASNRLGSFSSGGLDVSLFPLKTWSRILREVLAEGSDLFSQGEGAGDLALREAIAEYLQSYRGVKCTAGQIVVGAGLELLTGMLVRLLAGKTIALENPGYRKNQIILDNMGIAMEAVPVDFQGMNPEALAASGAQVAYLTPSHQFPTGAVMPVGRRSALLHWAAQPGHLIIEDDYDSEFRFDGRPLPSLQGLDKSNRHVAYAGTFSRSLAPGLRAAYLVLPDRLLALWNRAYGSYSCTISRPEQHTLARFMAGGHFARHLNRMRSTYRSRRNYLLQQLALAFGPQEYLVENQHTGLYLILRLPGKDAAAIAALARQNGLRVRAVSEYLVTNNYQDPFSLGYSDALVVGYGGIQPDEIPAAAKLLAGCCQ